MKGNKREIRITTASKASVQGYLDESEHVENRIASLQAKAMAVEVALRLNAKRDTRTGRPQDRGELLLRAKRLKSARLLPAGTVEADLA